MSGRVRSRRSECDCRKAQSLHARRGCGSLTRAEWSRAAWPDACTQRRSQPTIRAALAREVHMSVAIRMSAPPRHWQRGRADL